MLSKLIRLAAATAFVGTAFVACGTETVSGDDECTPGQEASEPCTCSDGESGVSRCQSDGTGFGECDCDAPSGSGGSGGMDIGASGGSGGTSGSGGAGGSVEDAGVDATTDAGGDSAVTDAAADGSVSSDGSPDGAADDASGGDDGSVPSACNTCMLSQCNGELAACDNDPCTTPGDAGFSESDCMFFCLDEIFADGGVAGIGEVNHCADICGADGPVVTTPTNNLFLCMFGATDAAPGCESDCGY